MTEFLAEKIKVLVGLPSGLSQRSEQMCALLAEKNFSVEPIPVMKLEPRESNIALNQINFEQDVSIFVSPSAVKFFKKKSEKLLTREVYGLGPGTEKAVVLGGFNNMAQIADPLNSNLLNFNILSTGTACISEADGMYPTGEALAEKLIKKYAKNLSNPLQQTPRFFIFKGLGGHQVWIERLQSFGFVTIEYCLYERLPALENSFQLVTALKNFQNNRGLGISNFNRPSPLIILLTSFEMAKAFFLLLNQPSVTPELLTHLWFTSVSDRMTEFLKQHKVERIISLKKITYADIVEQLVGYQF